MSLACNEQGEGCRVGSHPLWYQKREQQRLEQRQRTSQYFLKQGEASEDSVGEGRVCVCATGARTYDHLKKSRDEERLKRTMLSEVLQYIQDSSACQQWLSRQADM